MKLSCISTLPHLFSILPLLPYYKKRTFGYVHCILLSTSCSVLYHIYDESNSAITFVDYSVALAWFIYDLYFAYMYTTDHTILLGNGISFLIGMAIPYNESYTVNHSLWHIINAYKSFYVSTRIATICDIHPTHSTPPRHANTYLPHAHP